MALEITKGVFLTMSGISIHISATSGSLFLCRRPMLDSFSWGRRLHSRVPGRILVELFRDGQRMIYTNVHIVAGHHSLGELGILCENLLCSSGKQLANANEFHCLVSISPAKIVLILPIGILIEVLRRLAQSVDGRRARHLVKEGKQTDSRE